MQAQIDCSAPLAPAPSAEPPERGAAERTAACAALAAWLAAHPAWT